MLRNSSKLWERKRTEKFHHQITPCGPENGKENLPSGSSGSGEASGFVRSLQISSEKRQISEILIILYNRPETFKVKENSVYKAQL